MLSNFCINFLQLWRILMRRQKYVEWTFIFDSGMESNDGGCGGWNNFLQDWSWSTSIQGGSKLPIFAYLFFYILKSRIQRNEKFKNLEGRGSERFQTRGSERFQTRGSRTLRKEEASKVLDSRIQRKMKTRDCRLQKSGERESESFQTLEFREKKKQERVQTLESKGRKSERDSRLQNLEFRGSEYLEFIQSSLYKYTHTHIYSQFLINTEHLKYFLITHSLNHNNICHKIIFKLN